MKQGAALFALASIGLFAVNYDSGETGSQLFLTEKLEADEAAFLKYLTEFSKSYATKEEYKFRLAEFKKSWNHIAEHDEIATGHTVGLNHFSDYTDEEYRKMLGLKMPQNPEQVRPKTENMYDFEVKIADSVDWRKEGAVTGVKNQGACGSCWAFCAVGAMETAYAVETGLLETFSEQQLLDCTVNVHGCCNGCNGGWIWQPWEYLKSSSRGAVNEQYYPYTAKQGDCQNLPVDPKYIPSGYTSIGQTASALKIALNYNALAVAIEAENVGFRMYSGGIIKSGCGSNIDHGVTVVGYGADESGQEYFIVKNSWGEGWGEEGYVRIAPDQCAITSSAMLVNFKNA